MIRKNSLTNTQKPSDDNFSILDVIDAVKKVLIEKGLMESLKEDFDKFSRKQLTNSYQRVADKNGFIKKCVERLTDSQIPDFTKNPQ